MPPTKIGEVIAAAAIVAFIATGIFTLVVATWFMNPNRKVKQ